MASEITRSPSAEGDAAHTHGIAALENPHIGHGKPDALSVGGRQKHVVRLAANLDIDDFLAFVEPHRDLAGAVDLGEIGEFVAPDGAARCREHDIEGFPGGLVLGQGHDRGDPLALRRAAAD